VQSEEIQQIIKIVEDFIKTKNLICYGGTAINNILPVNDQFYDKDVEIPDYDFFTSNALDDAKELADIYFKKGFTDVEAKSGQHHGTFKVFVNFMPIADLTFLDKGIFNALKKDAIRNAGILYASPNFLRMSMYLELSRPAGDTSRWEKVLKRLTLLNKNYPLTKINCQKVDLQRKMDFNNREHEIHETIRNTFVNQEDVFFGGYALSLYSQYMSKTSRERVTKIADFDVLSEDPETSAEIVKKRLNDIGVKNVNIIKRAAAGEIVPIHYEIQIGRDSVAFVYKPIACHSYNKVMVQGKKVKIATIDTMLSFYLAFLYADRPYYNAYLERILCISQFLYDVEQKNRLKQKGLLKRFSISCYGHQESMEEMRATKAQKYKELKENRNSKEFQENFLNYRPADLKKREQPNHHLVNNQTRKFRHKHKQRFSQGMPRFGETTFGFAKTKKHKKTNKGFFANFFNPL
jgi:hypothetical protein